LFESLVKLLSKCCDSSTKW